MATFDISLISVKRDPVSVRMKGRHACRCRDRTRKLSADLTRLKRGNKRTRLRKPTRVWHVDEFSDGTSWRPLDFWSPVCMLPHPPFIFYFRFVFFSPALYFLLPSCSCLHSRSLALVAVPVATLLVFSTFVLRHCCRRSVQCHIFLFVFSHFFIVHSSGLLLFKLFFPSWICIQHGEREGVQSGVVDDCTRSSRNLRATGRRIQARHSLPSYVHLFFFFGKPNVLFALSSLPAAVHDQGNIGVSVAFWNGGFVVIVIVTLNVVIAPFALWRSYLWLVITQATSRRDKRFFDVL